jgi:hypothetical protein
MNNKSSKHILCIYCFRKTNVKKIIGYQEEGEVPEITRM